MITHQQPVIDDSFSPISAPAGALPTRIVDALLRLWQTFSLGCHSKRTLLLIACAAMQPSMQAVSLPELPRVYLNTAVASHGKSLIAADSVALKQAITDALPGDNILLLSGARYEGNFKLPAKSGSGWITISTMTELPSDDTRISPAFFPRLAKLVAPNDEPAVSILAGARQWRLLGVEVTADNPKNNLNWNIVFAYPGSRDTIIDRCYIHGQPTMRSLRGVLMDGDAIAVVNSEVSEVHYDGFDSQAIAGFGGSGPYKIVNNLIEGAGENIMFGGSRPSGPTVSSDIEVRRNHIRKPARWEQNTASWDGSKWTIKNLFELKSARRVLVEDNVFEGNWLQAQVGVAILFTVATGQSGCQAVVNDITFRNNVVKNTVSGFTLLARDWGAQLADDCRGEVRRVLIEGNLIIHRPDSQAYHVGWNVHPSMSDVIFKNNTFAWTVPVRFGVFFEGPGPATNLEMRNNIMARQVLGNSMAYGSMTLNTYFGLPLPIASRFTDNFSFLPPGDIIDPRTPRILGNVESPINPFVNPAVGNFRLKAGLIGGANIDALERNSSEVTIPGAKVSMISTPVMVPPSPVVVEPTPVPPTPVPPTPVPPTPVPPTPVLPTPVLKSNPSYFVPIAPCRAVDTRSTSIIAAATFRDFTFENCSIPANVTAVALNVTVVPSGKLGYLSIWPADQPQPLVSTMNSLDGRIKANAAIVGVGQRKAISVYVTDAAHVVLDVYGYFVPVNTPGALAFYPTSPCRVLDTRVTGGGGVITAASTRKIAVSSTCLPSTAQAYSLNITAVPQQPLGYVTLWPEGLARPLASTLNALTGTVVANAAILRSGPGGAFNVFATHDTHLVVDANGYFAPPGQPGALAFYAIPPCRMSDTRNVRSGFGAPSLAGNSTRDYEGSVSGCGVPADAKAYVLNATVVPNDRLGYLTLWPGGITQPTVSTLNALDRAVTSNAAIVPVGSNGRINTYASHTTDLLLDIAGFFTPAP